MTPQELLSRRLFNQNITPPGFSRLADTVAHLGAMQAQDYEGGLWALGVRHPGSTRLDVVQAIDNREIVRSWPMRGTLHFVPARDLGWMLKLMAPKVIKRSAARYRQLGLDDETFERSRKLFVAALRGGKQLGRSALYVILSDAGIVTTEQRGYHILCRLCQEGLLCGGPYIGKEPGFSLLEEWVDTSLVLSYEESLAELTRRYFTSHGPARAKDFAWWSGLTLTETKMGLAMNAAILASEEIGGHTFWFHPNSLPPVQKMASVHLLPGFDEYVLGYTDRSEFIEAAHHYKVVPGNNGMFMPTIVIDGQVVGLWRRVVTSKRIRVSLAPFADLTEAQIAVIQEKVHDYGRFMGVNAELSV